MVSTKAPGTEDDRLDAALRRKESAFHRLVESHRAEFHAHCYRMLGSLHDAEDALQDALLRAWRGLPNFDGRSSLRTWLYRIATNACLDILARRPKRVLPLDYGPPRDPASGESDAPVMNDIWIEPYPDGELGLEDGYSVPEARYEQREAVELAFVAALQHLPVRQRAVLILREVLGFSAKEVASLLDATPTSVHSTLQRARRTAEERLPDRSQQATLRSLGDKRQRSIVERFVKAFEDGDVKAILAMLVEDVSFAMPPYPDWCRGREAVGRSWLMPGGPPPRLRYVPTRANGQLAVGTYGLDQDGGRYVPLALDVLTLRADGQITDVFAFRTPDVFGSFGLPAELPA
jgi:RNA polymerase sigma-70 factor (ECF subfamily)